ncbi:bifunctional 4-hydroxy-2-oxoglutarate aldolase/2-dehydro-3-deoxy-phosphogluconate aldolase [Spirochaeta dissipatitropha]
MSSTLLNDVYKIGLVPVVKIDDANSAPGLAKALQAGGIPIAEITFRTEAAADSIKKIRDAVPDVLTGAGTVINLELAKKAVAAGAQFIISPGFNPAVVDFCLEQGIPVMPGVNNPSVIEAALERGIDTLKFFPAEASGGSKMLKALSGPFPQVTFVPTGGISAGNLHEYISMKNVLAVGGSWMVPEEAIKTGKWDLITQLCQKAVQTMHGFSFAHVGINSQDDNEAAASADFFSLLGLEIRNGASSIFASDAIEIMKSPYLGTHGHIAIRTWNIDRATAFLEKYGFKAVEETAKYKDGNMIAIYLEPGLGGFALHLLQ